MDHKNGKKTCITAITLVKWKRTPLYYSKRYFFLFMAKLRVKLPSDSIDSLMITKHSYRKVSKFRKKKLRAPHNKIQLAKQWGEKWPNFCLSTNHPDNNLKQIGALFFLFKLYLIKHMWNATHKIFLELLVSDCQKNVQFVCTANNYITQLTLLNMTMRSKTFYEIEFKLLD